MPTFLPRVETVVSFQQLEQDFKAGKPESAAGGQSPVSSCNGQVIPLYSYAVKVAPKAAIPRTASSNSVGVVPDTDSFRGGSPSRLSATDEDFACEAVGNSSQDEAIVPVLEVGALPQESLLDTVLLALWEDCAEQGLFRYDVTACCTKVLPGIYGFVAQLNEGRATQKRPTEFRVDQVCQPFDTNKFNFTKAFMREVLLQFEPSTSAAASRNLATVPSGALPDPDDMDFGSSMSAGNGSQLVESAVAGASPSVVLINVSPIEYGHVLLVPRVNDYIPQLVDPSTMLMALHFALEANNPYFRVGYNSLGAYATINHLHFQAYYLAAPFACERAPTTPLLCPLKRKRVGSSSVQISRTTDYPVNGFVIEVGNCLEEMADIVGRACLNLQAANIPHNLLICDSGSRVFLWPQCYAERQAAGVVPQDILDTGVNPAVFEIAGHMVLKRRDDYEAINQDLAWRMLEQVSLPEDRFMQAASICFGG